jgi:hypothetical protein
MATWTDSGYNAAPSGSDSPTLGDDGIRSTRKEVYERAKNEHYVEEDTSSDGTRANDWHHREGSARAYREATEPTTKPNSSALNASDEGRLWVDSDTDLLYIYDGSSWDPLIREIARFSIQGNLTTGTDLVPAMIFPRACTVKKVSARVGTATSGADLQISLNKNATATSSIFTTDPFTISAGSNTSSTTGLNTTNAALSADDYLTFDIDQVGSTTAGADLSVVVEVVLG